MPTIFQFTQALFTPAASFATLKGLQVVCTADGAPVLRRTTRYAEAEVLLDGGRYLLSMPLSLGALAQTERTLTALQRLRHPALAAVKWLPAEWHITTPDGRPQCISLVLQELPGEPLREVYYRFSVQQLSEAIEQLKADLASLNLAHHNLKVENLRYVAGRLVPIRYFYATLDGAAEEDRKALDGIYTELAGDEQFVVSDCDHAYNPLPALLGHKWVGIESEGLICVEDKEGFGYVDAMNRVVIEPRFRWADDFHEGRAVVETDEGMALIDRRGHYVLPPIYEIVEYRPSDTLIQARQGGLWARFDYMGRQISPFGVEFEI